MSDQQQPPPDAPEPDDARRPSDPQHDERASETHAETTAPLWPWSDSRAEEQQAERDRAFQDPRGQDQGFHGPRGAHPQGHDPQGWPAPAPSTQAQHGPGVPPAYAAPTALMPQRPQSSSAPRGRLAGWVWPVIATMALVLGLGGGFAGGWAFESINDEPGVRSSSAPPDLEGSTTQAPLPVDNASISAVAEQVLPSTVQIVAEYQGQDGGATGSGFVVDDQGHIVTNNHVVADSAKDGGTIQVVDQRGNHFDAKLVGRSPVYDLAVLEVKEATEIQAVSLGSSQDLRIGDGVVAIGSPLGLTATVTSGIVSAKNRAVTTGDSADDASYIDAVQTDAAINPGNSGGPLVNLAGQVVGVNSAIATTGGGLGGEAGNIGVGFAIPIEQVRTTTAQILETGEAQYPVIGATVKTENGPQGDPGATIIDVSSDSPARDAGLKADDVVVAVDGQRVTDGKSLIVAIRTHQPGDTIDLTLVRGGEERTVSVTLDGKVG